MVLRGQKAQNIFGTLYDILKTVLKNYWTIPLVSPVRQVLWILLALNRREGKGEKQRH